MAESAPAPRKPYLDNAALRALVRAYRGKGTQGDDLARALLAIAGGVWDRFHFTADKDDFCQEVVLHLLGPPLRSADLNLNLFGFFTTCAVNYGKKLRAKECGDRRGAAAYAAGLVEAGRPVVGGVVGRPGSDLAGADALAAAEDAARDAENLAWIEQLQKLTAVVLERRADARRRRRLYRLRSPERKRADSQRRAAARKRARARLCRAAHARARQRRG